MSKRLQVVLTEEAWKQIESITSEANHNFEMGSINCSDVINEMVLNSRVDIKTLQMKHADIRRSLLVLAAKDDIDLDTVIKTLSELKAKGGKKKQFNLEDQGNA